MDQARNDLDRASSDVERGFFDRACVSAQQSAEKAAKSVFNKMGVEAWGRSVADLLEELSKSRTVPSVLFEGSSLSKKRRSKERSRTASICLRHGARRVPRTPTAATRG
jgi:HEPN domain-containing protein